MITEEIRNGEKWMIVINDKVILRGNSHAVLWENSHAVLRGNSHAVLWGNSHAVLRGNSHAVLRENSHAELWGNSHAVLRDFSVVHKKSKTVKINKGKKTTVIIPNYPSKIIDWAKMKNIKIKNGKILLWKVITKNGMDFCTNKISYLEEPMAPDWDSKYSEECGKGLHLADSPSGARHFVFGKEFRLIQVSANVKDCVCFPGNPQYPMKIRARACKFVKEFPPDYIEKF